MKKINHVLISGGTHGNELIGVYLVRKFEQAPELIAWPSFKTLTLIGNPKATEIGVRYLDRDLNRAFEPQALESAAPTQYEIQRAKEVYAHFGQEGKLPIDLIIDLHSTTSNAGLMLILDNDTPFTMQLAAHLCRVQPQLKVYSSANSGRNRDSLRSIAPYRIGIEVGPVAHSTLHAELFQETEKLTHAALQYVEQYNLHHCNNPSTAQLENVLTIYQYVGAVDFPRNDQGQICAMIHPQLQFQDYQPLHSGNPLFLTFDGDTITYEGDSTVYPVFINEAAYYEKGIALCLTQKIVHRV